MRRSLLYSAFALCFAGICATAADRYGEWTLEEPRPFVFTLSFKQSVPRDDRVITSEFGFVCDENEKFIGAILASV